MHRKSLFAACMALALAGCSSGPAGESGSGTTAGGSSASTGGAGGGAPCDVSPAPPSTDGPRYEDVWQIATHNSYWVNHGVADPLASGVQERFADQLLVDHARSVEIDLHRDDDVPHGFRVYHTEPGNSLCDSLDECLGVLRAIHYALPRHEAFEVNLELKEITASNFDAAHTIEDLDRILEDGLGAALFRPRDLLKRCSDAGLCATTLGDCAAALGWPLAGDLRGKFVVAILGNWDALGGQATTDWVDYALHGDVRDRAAFPMASSWQLDRTTLPVGIQAQVSEARLGQAFAESAVLQVEDTADPRLAPFVARHGLVRIDGANAPADQDARLALGAQMLQTDTPWIQTDDLGASQPFRILATNAGIVEPGERLALGAAPTGARTFAYRQEAPASTVAWEATIASGAVPDRVGCLRAAASLGATNETSVTLCRTKSGADRTAGAPGSPTAEELVLMVTACEAGACTQTQFPSSGAGGGIGDLVSLLVTSAASGPSCVQARSASLVDTGGSPAWHELGSPSCVNAPLPYQGLARPTANAADTVPSSFVGATRTVGSSVTHLRATDFADVVVEGPVVGGVAPPPASDPTLLVDTSST